MNISYQKTFGQNNMIISDFYSKADDSSYQLKMLENNSISGLLKMDTMIIDNIPSFIYDISSKHSLESFLSSRKINAPLLRTLLIGLYKLNENLMSYLLDWDYILLLPEVIFLNPETMEPYFCFCPVNDTITDKKHDNFMDNFRELLRFILTKTDHDDNECVLLAYNIQQRSLNDNFSFDDLFEILNRGSKPEPETKPDIPVMPEKNDSNPFTILTSSYNFQPSNLLILGIIFFILITIISIVSYLCFISQLFSRTLYFIICGVIFILISSLVPILKKFFFRQAPVTLQKTNISPKDTDEQTIGATVLINSISKGSLPTLKYTGTDSHPDIPITTIPFTIGKLHNNTDFVLNNPLISRIHGKIYLKENHYYFEDMNSSNGSYINSISIPPHSLREINDGDFITFAHLTYIFKLN